MSHYRSLGFFCLYSSAPGVAFLQSALDGVYRVGNCPQYLDGRAGPDRRCMDL